MLWCSQKQVLNRIVHADDKKGENIIFTNLTPENYLIILEVTQLFPLIQEHLVTRSTKVLLIIIALALLPALSFAFTLSGNIDGGVFLGGITYIYAVPLEFTGGIPEFAIGLAPLGTGPYAVLAVDAGDYILFAYQDRDNNLIPSADDYFGYYGEVIPEIVTVNGNMSGLDIEIAPLPFTLIEGTIAYNGMNSGLTLVQAAADPEFTEITNFSIVLDFTGAGAYSMFTDPGQYYLRAFMDLDANLEYSEGDPGGYYGYPGTPVLVDVTGGSASGIDFDVFDPMNLAVNLTPLGTPIIIPAQGGSFSYEFAIANNGESAAAFDVWTDILLPSGTAYGPILLRTITMPAGAQLSRLMTQAIPGGAPAGTYYYRAFAGTYPALAIAESSFEFEKSAVYDLANGSDVWNISGWEGESGDSMLPLTCRMSAAYPNPFNSETEIEFDLTSPETVKISVYDLQGRVMLEWGGQPYSSGEHRFRFNLQGYSSGIYFLRLSAGNASITQKLIFQK